MHLNQAFVLLSILISSSLAEEDGKENEPVKFIDLSSKGLISLNEYNFSKYHDLEEVDLSNNDIHFIKEDMFVKNLKMRKLNLSRNKNLKLPEYSTLLIGNIQELNLSSCNIEEFPPNILDGLTDLRILDLSGNPLIEDSIPESTLINLSKPEKIILPYVDEVLIKKICNELDIIIGIKNTYYSDSIHCNDVREGKWNNVAKEADNYKITTESDGVTLKHTALHRMQALKTLSEDEMKTETPTVTKASETNIISVTKANIRNSSNDKETPKTNVTSVTNADFKNNTKSEVKSKPTNVEDSNTTVIKTEYPTSSSVDKVNLNATNVNLHYDMQVTTIGMKNIEPSTVELYTEKSNLFNNNSTISIQTPANKEEKQSAKESIHEDKKSNSSENSINKEVLPQKQRGILKIETQSENSTTGLNVSEKMVARSSIIKDKTEANTTADASTSSTGSTILIILVVGVIIAGIGAFGYKFYRTRKYQAANPSDGRDRELQEITTDKKLNGVNTISNATDEKEKEPLMENQETNADVKTVNQSGHDNGNSHGPTNNPYMPTTMPIVLPKETLDNK